MQVLTTIDDLQRCLSPHRQHKIALVPTMGNLHAGHLSLVSLAKQHADVVVVSIFVNPTQFGVGEDFDSYPRTLDEDLAALQKAGVDIVFAPNTHNMYPNLAAKSPVVQINAGAIAQILCGNSRPTHFAGVCLVVSKLFNIVRPDVAVFGKKDYQQLAIIRKLNDELNFGIKIIGGEIVRADDGLALSSRNGYLNKSERQIAHIIYKILQALKEYIINQDNLTLTQIDTYRQECIDYLNAFDIDGHRFLVDYLEIRPQNLDTLDETHLKNNSDLVILIAVWLGKTRLLDNIEINYSK